MTQQQEPKAPQASPKSRDETLDELLKRTGYEITQENGHRKYGPPPDWTGPPPPKGSEVFVGKVPRDALEGELVPVFEGVGPIYELRLMMDYDENCNRGFAFVMYTCPEDAKKAIEELDNHQIRKGRHLGVCKSVDNCRLFVGGIPRTKSKEEILEEMRKITDSVSNVILYSSIVDKSRNRGFAFVEYESHKAAAMARRKLIPGKIPLWGNEIAVDWAEPEPEVDEETMAKVTILYVRNLLMNTTEEKLREVFSVGDTLRIDKVKKLRDFAFIHYRTREDAEAALDQLNNIEIDECPIEVTWAKPVDRFLRQRNPRQNQVMPGMAPYIYGPPTFDPYGGHIPFTNCPRRGAFIHRMPTRGRGRGAAGIRRFKNYGPNGNQLACYKPQEFQPGKLGRIPEEGKSYGSEYMYLPVNPNSDAMEATMAVQGAPIMPYGPHPRMGHPQGFLHAPPGYEEVPCYAFVSPQY